MPNWRGILNSTKDLGAVEVITCSLVPNWRGILNHVARAGRLESLVALQRQTEEGFSTTL